MTHDTRAILRLLADGHAPEDLPRLLPGLAPADLRRAAQEALASIDAAPRVETRDERIARLRRTHPRAYAPWTEEEDASLLRRFDEGARSSDLSKELGRPLNAIRVRLEKWLGPSWKRRGAAPEDP